VLHFAKYCLEEKKVNLARRREAEGGREDEDRGEERGRERKENVGEGSGAYRRRRGEEEILNLFIRH
jgi:hypothetical protein